MNFNISLRITVEFVNIRVHCMSRTVLLKKLIISKYYLKACYWTALVATASHLHVLGQGVCLIEIILRVVSTSPCLFISSQSRVRISFLNPIMLGLIDHNIYILWAVIARYIDMIQYLLFEMQMASTQQNSSPRDVPSMRIYLHQKKCHTWFLNAHIFC